MGEQEPETIKLYGGENGDVWLTSEQLNRYVTNGDPIYNDSGLIDYPSLHHEDGTIYQTADGYVKFEDGKFIETSPPSTEVESFAGENTLGAEADGGNSENSEDPTNDTTSDAADGIPDYSNQEEGSVESAVSPGNEENPTGEKTTEAEAVGGNSGTSEEPIDDAGTDGGSMLFTSTLPVINTIDKVYDSDDANAFVGEINNCIDYYYDDVRTSIDNASVSFEDFNQKTKEMLEAINITWSNLFEEKSYGVFPNYYRQLLEYLEDIVENLKQNIKEIFDTNERRNTTPTHGNTTSFENRGSSGGVISGSVIDTTIDTSPIIASVTFGSIVLTTATTLYETIGGVGISANLTGNYSVIGITKENDKYYYKVIDNATKKVYYMEMTDDVKFQTEYKNLLHIKENAMMLSSMEIGSDNFVKLADPNTIYFIQNETENNGITFYNVIDANDGKSYYIPGSDSVESIPLDSIASIVDTPTTETTTVTGEGV